MSDFGTLFGKLVAREREKRGWSLAQLAVAAYGDDGEGGETRKSDVLKLEHGTSRKPNAATIRKYRIALDLEQTDIDACRTPAEIELAHFADRLFSVMAEAAKQAGLPEDFTAALSERYAEGNPANFDGALNGLKAALETAAQDQARGAMPSNLGQAVDDIVARIDAMNDAGDIDEADAELDADLARRRAERDRQNAEDSRILEKAITQATYTRNADKLAERALALVQLGKPGAEDQFHALRAMRDERYQEGLRLGTPFALEAAIGLAKQCDSIAPTPYLRAMAQNDLGIALQDQGIRIEGPAGAALLAEAVTAYNAALTVYALDAHPVDWAMTQNNLGVALMEQSSRTEGAAGAALLTEAVTAYRAALTVRTKDAQPVYWAATQNNLGNALQTQGTRTEGEAGAALLAEAVTAYRAALTVRTKDAYPVGWAVTQHNLPIHVGD